ncbi:uncharacterized protein LOC129972532 [Argiope bruennichi]|uniref:uncharacterized protein LOC129972532 n=1 Tax=Argiope bruennichi TaxID=94029 RepID=UPI002494FE76|nr:uncharacterized protein LOC129972532 [Argiope bruennichi]
MFPVPSLLTVAKYGFISMVVTSAGFLIGNVIVMKHHTGEPLDDLVYKPRTSRQLEDTAPGLDRGYSKCFTEPTKTFCFRSANEPFKISDVDEREKEDEIQPIRGGIRRNPVYSLLSKFSKYMNSLGIQAVILEPSMLFCAISSSNKYNLLIKDFNPHEFQGSHQTVTVGIFEDDAKILDETIWEDSQNKTSKYSFEAFRIRKWLIDAQQGEHALYSVHFLFSRGSLEVHVVVLFTRNGYLWHSGTDLPSRDLLFVKEGTYENFTTFPLTLKDDQNLNLYLPSSPAQFLLQIPHSEFLNCQPSEEVKIFPHPTLTEDQLVNRAVIAIQELKASFQTHFVTFWIWTESLSGWFAACNIFQETYELNVAVFSSSVKRLNLTEIWANNNYLEFLESHYMDGRAVRVTLGCFGLRINIFICQEGREIVWYHRKTEEDGGSRREIPFKFRLCSSDVLGQRINVPCESGQIVQQQTRLAELTTTDTLDTNGKYMLANL